MKTHSLLLLGLAVLMADEHAEEVLQESCIYFNHHEESGAIIRQDEALYDPRFSGGDRLYITYVWNR